MFFFFDVNPRQFPVANVVKRGRLEVGSFANIDCVNAQRDKRIVRLVSFESFLQIVGISPRSPTAFNSLARFLTSPNVRTKRSESIVEKLRNGYIVKDEGRDLIFIDYRILTEFCRLMSWLRNSDMLNALRLEYAKNCERFMLGLADVGLAAMIDEATGYDKVKKRNEYQDLFKAFIREEHGDWVKEFPDDFFNHLYRVYHCERKGRNHPQFFAHVITKYIYWPLADSQGAILEKLKEKDPIVQKSGRRYRLHQFLSEVIGKPALRMHIGSITTLLALSSDKGGFKRLFKKRYPKAGDQMEFDFDDV